MADEWIKLDENISVSEDGNRYQIGKEEKNKILIVRPYMENFTRIIGHYCYKTQDGLMYFHRIDLKKISTLIEDLKWEINFTNEK